MKMKIVSGSATVLLVCSVLGGCYQQAPATGAAPTQAAPTVAAEKVAPPPVVCNSCGVVRSVTAITQDGRGTGAGAVIGGIVGGVAGNQVGGGSGRDIATVAGAIGGAVLGNEVEQNRNSTTVYEVVVDMQGGGQQVITMADASGIRSGSAVTVQGGSISLR